MFFENDIVVVTCRHPAGVETEVFGRIGVITEIDEDKCIKVKDIYGDEFSYLESELRDADWEEIAVAFTDLVKERI